MIGVSGNINGYSAKNNPLFIHFEHESWKPRIMEKKVRKLKLSRMVKVKKWNDTTMTNEWVDEK